MTPEELKKLPKWAQDKISTILYENRMLKINNRTFRKELPPSNTYVCLEKREIMNLDKSARVVFKGKDVLVQVYVDLDGLVRVDFNDGIILPYARNVIYITDRHNSTNK